jgi:hypothetical protein
MLTTVFSYSQTSQPLRTNLNGVSGVFIGLPLMDSISLKLIDRNHLKREIKTLGDLALVIEEKNAQLEQKVEIAVAHAASWGEVFDNVSAQNRLLIKNFEAQKELTTIHKKRARRNALLFFGGGLAVGFTAFAILIN